MSWGDGVPNPFDEAKDKALEKAGTDIGLLRKALVNTKQRLLFIRYDGMPFNQRLSNEEMVDAIDAALKETGGIPE